MTQDVKALLFDVFGTVVDWLSNIAREMEILFTARGMQRDWTAFTDVWRNRDQPVMEEVRRGLRPFAKLDDLHRANPIDVLNLGLKTRLPRRSTI